MPFYCLFICANCSFRVSHDNCKSRKFHSQSESGGRNLRDDWMKISHARVRIPFFNSHRPWPVSMSAIVCHTNKLIGKCPKGKLCLNWPLIARHDLFSCSVHFSHSLWRNCFIRFILIRIVEPFLISFIIYFFMFYVLHMNRTKKKQQRLNFPFYPTPGIIFFTNNQRWGSCK
jgi:hypothetical protein